MEQHHEIKIPEKLLDDTHYHSIVTALAIKGLAQRHLDDAKAIGMDISKLQQTFDESMDKLLAIRRQYFPGR